MTGAKILLLLIPFLLLSPVNSPAEDKAIGKITNVQGKVTVKKRGYEKDIAVGAGDSLFIGDVLKTVGNSKAQVIFTDDAIINMTSDTAIRTNQYIYESEKNRRMAVVKVLAGRARFIVYKIMSNDSAFNVETDSALVTTDMADFTVSVQSSDTEVAVLENTVNVKNSSYLIVGETRLGVNQRTFIKKKSPPSAPSVLTPEQRRSYLRDA